VTRACAAAKIVTLERLCREIALLRREGHTIALANGLFDLLHVGHLRYLEGARAEADALLVGVNSDRSASFRRTSAPSSWPAWRASTS
jgi:cytidyltransferase-like protein